MDVSKREGTGLTGRDWMHARSAAAAAAAAAGVCVWGGGEQSALSCRSRFLRRRSTAMSCPKMIAQVRATQIQTADDLQAVGFSSSAPWWPLVDFGFCIRPTVVPRCRTWPRASCIGKSMLGLLRPARSRLTGWARWTGLGPGESEKKQHNETARAAEEGTMGWIRGTRRNPSPRSRRSRSPWSCPADPTTPALTSSSRAKRWRSSRPGH